SQSSCLPRLVSKDLAKRRTSVSATRVRTDRPSYTKENDHSPPHLLIQPRWQRTRQTRPTAVPHWLYLPLDRNVNNRHAIIRGPAVRSCLSDSRTVSREKRT